MSKEIKESNYFDGINLNIVNLWGSALLCNNVCVAEFCEVVLGDDECLVINCCSECKKGGCVI